MTSNAISFQVRRKFREHHSRCCDILNTSGATMTPQLSLELYSVMYVISDYAAFGYEHNREIVSDALLSKIIPTLSMTYPQFTSVVFRNRITFYSQVVGGLELHAHVFMGRDVSDVHPVLRCTVAFSDCCLYPAYIENYNAPRPLLSALDVMNFGIDVMEPLDTEFASLYMDICDICALPAPAQTTKVNSPVESSVQVTKNSGSKKHSWFIWMCVAIIVFEVFFVLPWLINSPAPHIIDHSQDAALGTAPTLAELPRPKNGEQFLISSFPCVSPLSIETSYSGDCYFILADHNTGSAIMSFYVHAGSSIDIDVPVGTFDIYYACGDSWYGTDSLFGPDTIYQRCDESFSFSEFSGWTVQLQPVSYGNLDTEYVSPEDFPK